MGPHPGRAAGRKARAAFVLGGKSSSDTLPNGGGLETASCCPKRGQHLPPGSDLGSMVSNRTLFPKSPLPRAAKGFSCSTQGRLDPASAPLLLPNPTHQRAGSLGAGVVWGFFPFSLFFPFLRGHVTSISPLCRVPGSSDESAPPASCNTHTGTSARRVRYGPMQRPGKTPWYHQHRPCFIF